MKVNGQTSLQCVRTKVVVGARQSSKGSRVRINIKNYKRGKFNEQSGGEEQLSSMKHTNRRLHK